MSQIQAALLLLHLLQLIALRLDLTAQLLHFTLQLLELRQHVHQALTLHQRLDARNAILQITGVNRRHDCGSIAAANSPSLRVG